jgi:hypothetical protein
MGCPIKPGNGNVARLAKAWHFGKRNAKPDMKAVAAYAKSKRPKRKGTP